MFSSLNELLKLPDKPRLDSGELDKAKASMKDLRSRGFTNKEVSLLTRGRGSENTVKKYTRGVKVQSTVARAATMYGGFEKTLSALNQYNDIIQINRLYKQAQANFNQTMQRNQELINQNAQLETQNKAFGAYATTAQGLLSYGYDLASLSALKKLAEKYGGPVSLFDAIGEYQGLEAIRQTKVNITETNRTLDATRVKKEAELAVQEAFIERANKMIGAIEANQRKEVAAQIVYELMTAPENIEIESSRVKRVILHFLLGVRQYGERNKEKINGWNDIELSLRWLIEGLTKIN